MPLYLYPDPRRDGTTFPDGAARHPNLDAVFTNAVSKAASLAWLDDGRGDLERTVGPESILHLIYAELHSGGYRERYDALLRSAFPRVFVPRERELLSRLSPLGGDLISLHLLEDDYEAASWRPGPGPLTRPITRFVANAEPEAPRPTRSTRTAR